MPDNMDGSDFLTWQPGFGIGSDAMLSQGDADGNGAVNNLDLMVWQQQLGTTPVQAAVAVPELSTVDVVIILVLICGVHWSRQNLDAT
jgi:hypothetical protein